MLTAVVARQWVPDTELDTNVSVISADIIGGNTSGLTAGDVLTWRDVFYGLLVPSGNDAGMLVARLVGAMIRAAEGSTGDNVTRFLAAMNAKASQLGLSSVIAGSSHGVDSTSRMSPADAATLFGVMVNDAFLRTVAGTLTRNLTVTGPNARTYSISHTFTPPGGMTFPEFVSCKTGYTATAGHCLALLWERPDGQLRITVTMGSGSDPARFTDMRSLIDLDVAMG